MNRMAVGLIKCRNGVKTKVEEGDMWRYVGDVWVFWEM